MPHYHSQEPSNFLSPAVSALRKSPSRQQTPGSRRSSASLPLDDSGTGKHHSLAHELAVALMPEPSSGSKLLAEEFGIEYDQGAEGIDPVPHLSNGTEHSHSDPPSSLASELATATHTSPSFSSDGSDDQHDDSIPPPNMLHQKKPEQDAMQVLAQDLQSTDKFLHHLRTIDIDSGASSSATFLESIASDVIRHINESVRDRESQVRELLECEREFRKIAGEVAGNDALGMLDELSTVEELLDVPVIKSENKPLESVLEEDQHQHHHPRSSTTAHILSHDWELDPDRLHLGDEDDNLSEATSPVKDSFPQPPPLIGPITPTSTVPQLAHFRSSTTSLVSHLTTLSEHAQVNRAATAEAGRKIRALKNKLGGWRMEWDSAERSRQRIEKWEAGFIEGDSPPPGASNNNSPGQTSLKRIDGRVIVQQHLRAFELALEDAATKTQAIMAIMAR